MNASKAVFAYINAPVLECWVPEGLFDTGIGNVVVAKKGRSGLLGVSVFLLDVFCLGAKNAFFRVYSETEYRDRLLAGISATEKLIPMEAACVRKLVTGAVDFGKKLGIPPYRDYRLASKILLNIDTTGCSIEFEYGQNGKPMFMAGPHDSAERCNRILDLLERKCGPNGYHYLLPVLDDGEDWEGDEEDNGFETEE
jgi:hypothetical protein